MTSKEAITRAKKFGQTDTAMLILSADHVARQIREIAPAHPQGTRLYALAAQLDAGLGRFGLPSDAAAEALVDQHAAALAAATPARKGGAA